MWILRTPPATAVAAGAAATGAAAGAATAGAASSAASSASSSTESFAPSTTSAVSGERESRVFVSFAPKICPIFKHPSRFNNPESTNSSKIAGSSRFAGSIMIPASALQHNTAGSFACCFAVSAVIDILFPPFNYFANCDN